MKMFGKLTFPEKICMTAMESLAIFLTVYFNQMIITVFPNYSSVMKNGSNKILIDDSQIPSYNHSISGLNCTLSDPSNIYVALLIGFKYCLELIMIPIIGVICDKYHAPLILFVGLLVQISSCIIYSVSGNYLVTITARLLDGCAYSTISTAGLTIIYNLYTSDRSRNKVITIDSIVVYISSFSAPFIAGSIFNLKEIYGEDYARILTFSHILPLLVLDCILWIPYAFKITKITNKIFNKNGDDDNSDKNEEEKLELNEKTAEAIENNHTEERKLLNNKDILEVKLDERENDDGENMKCDEDENNDKDEDNDEKIQKKTRTTMLVLLRDKHIWIVLVCLSASAFGGNSLETTLPTHMIRQFCSNPEQQGIVWLFGVLSFLGFVCATFVFHLIQQYCYIIVIISMCCNSAMFATISFCKPWISVGVVIGFVFFFTSIIEILLIPVIPKIIDSKYPKTYGSGSSLTIVTFTLSGLIGSFPLGPIVEYYGFRVMTFITAFICFTPAFSIICIKKFF